RSSPPRSSIKVLASLGPELQRLVARGREAQPNAAGVLDQVGALAAVGAAQDDPEAGDLMRSRPGQVTDLDPDPAARVDHLDAPGPDDVIGGWLPLVSAMSVPPGRCWPGPGVFAPRPGRCVGGTSYLRGLAGSRQEGDLLSLGSAVDAGEPSPAP